MSVSTVQICDPATSEILFQLFHNEVPSGIRPYFPHSHPEYEITIFLAGKGVYRVGGVREYDVRPGDVFLFRGNEPHFMGAIDPGEDVRTVGIHFLPRFVLPGGTDPEDLRYLRAFLRQDEVFSNRLPRNTPAAEAVRSLMARMQGESDEKKLDYPLMIKAELLAALVEINRCLLPPEGEAARVTEDQMLRISRSMRYIDAHAAEPLRVPDLAAGSGFSCSHYTRLFRLVALLSPMDYVLRKRVDLAKSELLRTDDTVLAVATRCGFNSTANFNRAFRRRTGMVPSAFRKAARGRDFSEDL